MNPFYPIDKETAAKIDLLIPEYLTVRATPNVNGSVSLDLEWMKAIVDIYPNEELLTLGERLERIESWQYAHLPRIDDISRFYDRPLNQQTLSELNMVFVELDRDRQVRGFATFAEMVSHELGVKPSLLRFGYSR